MAERDIVRHFRSDKAIEEMETTYIVGEVLGQGAFGVVNLVEHKGLGQSFACKIIKKRLGQTSQYEQQEREIGIMKSIQHENILQLFEVYESPTKIALILELCKGGELVKSIVKAGGCPDEVIRHIINQLIDAVTYLHRNRIVHRDIKPENILLKSNSEPQSYSIKMADFGLACYTDAANQVENLAGTPMYMAPEIVANLGYNHTCDIWSIGVMLYLLLCNYTKRADNLLHEMIKAGKIEYPDELWLTIDPRAKNLCEMILRFDPAMRISAGEIKTHPWLTNSTNSSMLSGNVLDLMKSYNAERRFKKAIHVVIASIRWRKLGRLRREKINNDILLHPIEECINPVSEEVSIGRRKASSSHPDMIDLGKMCVGKPAEFKSGDKCKKYS
ncbi:kinase-like domain-containing protein [Globomyces pollinis-pini]|nr:kinase-like domain-containing protein [Globomyces pollinis-pini]